MTETDQEIRLGDLLEGVNNDCPCCSDGEYCASECYHKTGRGGCGLCDGSGITMTTAMARAQSTLATELIRVVEAVEHHSSVLDATNRLRPKSVAEFKRDAIAAIRAECARLKVEVK